MPKKLRDTLSEDAWEKLSPAIQEYYEKTEDGYSLLLDGRTNTGALRRAKDRVQQERDDLKDELAALQETLSETKGKLKDIDNNDARKKGDIEKLEAQWLKEKEELIAAHETRESALKGYIEKTSVDGIVTGITARNTATAENARLLDPHLRNRIDVEFDKDTLEPTVRILADDGTPSTATVADFEKEVVDNDAYAAIIVANRSSGGGAADDRRTGGPGSALPTGGQSNGGTDLAKVDAAALVAILDKK